MAAASDDDERPLLARRVVSLASIGKIDNHGVVEHRPVALGHRLETASQLGNLLDLELADHIVSLLTVQSVVGDFLMADVVHARCLEAEGLVFDAEPVRPDGDHIRQAGDQRRRGKVEKG